MNTWQSRLLIGLLLLLFQWAWNDLNAPLPNTPEWATVFFCGAALLEYAVCRAMPRILQGRLCDDMQILAGCCIVLDALGFLGYMTKTSSVYYNHLMWGLSYVQWARLLFVDSNHARSVWGSVVRGVTGGRQKVNFKAKAR